MKHPYLLELHIVQPLAPIIVHCAILVLNSCLLHLQTMKSLLSYASATHCAISFSSQPFLSPLLAQVCNQLLHSLYNFSLHNLNEQVYLAASLDPLTM